MAMRAGVTTSVIAHATVLIVALAGLSSAKPMTPEMVDSISVDLVPISDLTNVRTGSLTSKVVKTDAPAIVDTPKQAELAKPTGNTDQDQVKPEETQKVTPAPTVNTAPEPQPAPDPTPTPDPPKDPTPTPVPEPVAAPVVAPAPAPTEPQQEIATNTADTPAEAVAPIPATRPPQMQAAPIKATPKDTKTTQAPPKPAPTPPKTTAAKDPSDKAAKIADQVAELINSEKSRGAVTGDGGQATLGKNTGKASVLSQSVIDMLSAAMLKCFNPPIAAIEEGATALVEVHLSRDGMVDGQPQVISTTGPTTGVMTGTAAVRAVLNCGQAGYTMLPPDMYDGDSGWNTVRVTFNASDVG